MSRFASLVMAIALLVSAGCGSNSCQDAVNASTACAAKLNTTAALDVQSCNAIVCQNKQAFIDCFVGIACPDLASYNAASAACAANNACQLPQ